jgi:hypothetical protein
VALLECREQRRRTELQFLGRVIAYAVNSPKDMDKALFKDAGRRGDNVSGEVPLNADAEEILPVTADMYEKWW